MSEKMVLLEIRRPKSRLELRMEQRLRTLENVLNVLLGIGGVAASFWAGWLVGSGAIW